MTRVLIVDDDPTIASVFARVLVRDHDVTVFREPDAALRAIESGSRFDVVLCDLTMPQMNGLELWQAVEAVSPEIAARFVFITAAVPESTSALDATGRPVLEKPISIHHLRRIVEEVSGRRTAASAAG